MRSIRPWPCSHHIAQAARALARPHALARLGGRGGGAADGRGSTIAGSVMSCQS